MVRLSIVYFLVNQSELHLEEPSLPSQHWSPPGKTVVTFPTLESTWKNPRYLPDTGSTPKNPRYLPYTESTGKNRRYLLNTQSVGKVDFWFRKWVEPNRYM